MTNSSGLDCFDRAGSAETYPIRESTYLTSKSTSTWTRFPVEFQGSATGGTHCTSHLGRYSLHSSRFHTGSEVRRTRKRQQPFNPTNRHTYSFSSTLADKTTFQGFRLPLSAESYPPESLIRFWVSLTSFPQALRPTACLLAAKSGRTIADVQRQLRTNGNRTLSMKRGT